MYLDDPYDFDIDVDISPLLDGTKGGGTVDGLWYELAAHNGQREPWLQKHLDRGLRNALLQAQWSARSRRTLDRRRAVRAPLLCRVQTDSGKHMTACDISMSGMRCSGRPAAPVMDVEFKLPTVQFPVEARVEVVSFKDANVIPLMGLRFAWIDRPYVDCIAGYVAERRQRQLRAAA